jgi:hypothetical protein
MRPAKRRAGATAQVPAGNRTRPREAAGGPAVNRYDIAVAGTQPAPQVRSVFAAGRPRATPRPASRPAPVRPKYPKTEGPELFFA